MKGSRKASPFFDEDLPGDKNINYHLYENVCCTDDVKESLCDGCIMALYSIQSIYLKYTRAYDAHLHISHFCPFELSKQLLTTVYYFASNQTATLRPHTAALFSLSQFAFEKGDMHAADMSRLVPLTVCTNKHTYVNTSHKHSYLQHKPVHMCMHRAYTHVIH